MQQPGSSTILIFFLFLFFSCTSNGERNEAQDQVANERVKIKGYDVSADSVAAPREIPAGKPRIVRA
ncbi:MAG TPA: hypothetical protein VN249_09220, partial [Prolixibacteraceae bacterium]|nr:hypothetical protein [Prolixibacteraceae bacterium]